MPLHGRDVAIDHRPAALDAELVEQEGDLPAPGRARISSFVSRSHSSRLNGPSAFLRVVYTNCWSVWSDLRSSSAFAKHHDSICSWSAFGNARVLVEQVLEARREVDLRGLDVAELVEQLVGQRRRPVLDGPGEAVLAARDLAEPLVDAEVDRDRPDRSRRA